METNKVYTINKGINKPIEFRGLKAQYIWHLAASVVGVLVVFAIGYVAGISGYALAPLTLGLGGWLTARVYKMSRRYGQHGLMKRRAMKGLPTALMSRSRHFFIDLFGDDAGTIK